METWTHNLKQIERRCFLEAHQPLQLLDPQRTNKRTHRSAAKLTQLYYTALSFWFTVSIPEPRMG